MKRWSSLQREIYKLMDENINFQIHLSRYRMDSTYGSTDLPRYWITLDGETIFDYPKQFICKDEEGHNIKNLYGYKYYYPYENEASDMSDLIREYIDTPKDEVFSKHFENDCWGFINIIKAADRRFGTRRLEALKSKTHNKAALKVIERRLNNQGGCYE